VSYTTSRDVTLVAEDGKLTPVVKVDNPGLPEADD
jgi:hypothetical protein